MEVTHNSIGDAPMLRNLLGQIPPEEAIASVSGDGAYDTKGCHEAIALRQADAIIPIRKNAKLWGRTVLVPRRAMRFCERHAGQDEQSGKVERLPPTQSGRDQDALLQAAWRTHHGPRLRPPGR